MCTIAELFVFFFNDTATTEIYTLSLHDALPIWVRLSRPVPVPRRHPPELRGHPKEGDVLLLRVPRGGRRFHLLQKAPRRSEEHTSELQSQSKLVCRPLPEKKKTQTCCYSHNTSA